MNILFFSEHIKLMKAIDLILSGDADKIDVSEFHNRVYAEKINKLIEHSKSLNNSTVMRLNSAMGALGDNTLIKQTFDQVGIQSGLLSDMKENHQNMDASIGDISDNMSNIRDNTKNLLMYSEQVVKTMSDNIHDVQQSTIKMSEIDRDLQEFRQSIATIHKIADSVQNIARESNILALNASIEAGRSGVAGKGFGVLADNMRALAMDVQKSSEEIGQYVEQIAATVDNIAASMNDTTQLLIEGNEKTGNSLEEMNRMNSQLNDVEERLDSVFTAIDLQTRSTHNFANQMHELFQSNQALSDDCLALGKHIFKIGRYNDKTRSDLLKKNSNVSTRDRLSIFEVDHYVLTWRIYNNIVGFEQLKASQVNDPNGCKLGKWIESHINSRIARTEEFMAVKNAHVQLHTYATDSFIAKSNGNDQQALAAFNKTLNSYYVLQTALHALNDRLKEMGDDTVTEYAAF